MLCTKKNIPSNFATLNNIFHYYRSISSLPHNIEEEEGRNGAYIIFMVLEEEDLLLCGRGANDHLCNSSRYKNFFH